MQAMKKTILLGFLALSLAQGAAAQGIEFFHGSWQEAMQKAKELNRTLFLDVYTSWCVPCKKMAKETFTRQEVGAYFNQNFVNYQIDAEKGDGIAVAKKYKVAAYPTCLFIRPDGKVAHSFMGFQTVKQLLGQGQQAVKNARLLPELEQMNARYEAGERSADFLKAYCQKREEFGQHGGKPVNDLLLALNDDELADPSYIKMAKTANQYSKPVMDRLLALVEAKKSQLDKRAWLKINNTAMTVLSNYINDAIDNNQRTAFNDLYADKERLDSIEPSNQSNGMLASLGGGMSYMNKELIALTFLKKNNYLEEFRTKYAGFIGQLMVKTPADTLLNRSNTEAQAHYKFMRDTTITAEDKAEQNQTYGFLQMLTSVSSQLLAGSLFSSWDYYWGDKALTAAEKSTAISWLQYLYATWRNADLALPLAQKLVDIGAKAEAKAMLADLKKYLSLTEDEDKQLPKVDEALAQM